MVSVNHQPELNAVYSHGYTYVELLLALLIAGLLMAGLMGVVGTATNTAEDVSSRNDLSRDARFAMQRMVRNVSHSPRLLLPLNDNPNTNWPEHIREQTIPASPPIGDSTLATAVLAVTLPDDVDLDDNGFADADNDKDGRIDEDWGSDHTVDNAPGIVLIDDNGDGTIDISADSDPVRDNDEDNVSSEDAMNGQDDDGDGSINEDPPSDMNGDGNAGIAGVDDDSDGFIDEGNRNDDDEDGLTDEDGLEPVVFHLNGSKLIERMPMPIDMNFDFKVDGRDYLESTVAENVTRFRVERIDSSDGGQLIDLVLELSHPETGEVTSLQTQVRVGGAL